MIRYAVAAALVAAPAHAAPPPEGATPLFADQSVLDVRIDGPVKKIARAASRSTSPHSATLTVAGETHPIQLSARGLSRRNRDNCSFPPLRVQLQQKPAESSLFHKQRRLKLVAHCRDSDRYEQLVLREYAAYKLYNALTPESLQVRLARIQYVDDGEMVTRRWGFFIEDIDDTAKRLGGVELDIPGSRGVSNAMLDREDAARYALFQYMIGNTDWSMKRGPAGSDCCHNSKLVGAAKDARQGLTPVPYDFDNAGLVDAPYAVPSEMLPISKVTTRHYWGLCTHNAEVLRAAPGFIAARASLEGEISSIPGLEAREQAKMQRYLGEFFEDVSSPDRIERKLFRTCR